MLEGIFWRVRTDVPQIMGGGANLQTGADGKSFFGATLILTRFPTNVNPRYSQPRDKRTLLFSSFIAGFRRCVRSQSYRREHAMSTTFTTHEDLNIIGVPHETQPALFQLFVQIIEKYVTQDWTERTTLPTHLRCVPGPRSSVATRLPPSRPRASTVRSVPANVGREPCGSRGSSTRHVGHRRVALVGGRRISTDQRRCNEHDLAG